MLNSEKERGENFNIVDFYSVATPCCLYQQEAKHDDGDIFNDREYKMKINREEEKIVLSRSLRIAKKKTPQTVDIFTENFIELFALFFI